METNFVKHFLITLIWISIKFVTRSYAKEEPWLCRWTPVQKNTKFREGIGAGTFHHLGYTPNMETCVDLCCKMPLCGVAFRSKDRCYGVECVSDDSCETMQTEAEDEIVEISHVRAGKRPANATDMNMAGQCRPSPIYKEVTLKGGIHAGTYKDVGGVSTMEECQKKCCEFPACDLAFILASSCYLVGCADHKSCELQPAKKSNFHPVVSYVTRWNSEGVKHTVQLQEKNTVRQTCNPMKALDKVTLKGGLQVGDFTDVGKVKDLAQCYEFCCQQANCDLAFLLAQNCFSVQCKDKRLCTTVPAQPSIFNPQIAYVTSRTSGSGSQSAASTTEESGSNTTGKSPVVCPKTKVIDKVTLKGGVDAGDFRDNGEVADMDKCRGICCEMTQCHLAFMLGKNCFSVKCRDVDSCRAQPAKPSAYFSKISYVRKVGSNELLKPAVVDEATKKLDEMKGIVKEQMKKPIEMALVMGNLGDSHPAVPAAKKSAVKSKAEIASQLAKLEDDNDKTKEGQLPGEAHKPASDCKPQPTVYNVTLKGGRKAGEFKEVPHVKDMDDCISHCCEDKDKKCTLAFMLSNTCYSVTCKNKNLCSTIPAPPSGFNPKVAMVRAPVEDKFSLTKPVKFNRFPEPAVKQDSQNSSEAAEKKSEIPNKKPGQPTQKLEITDKKSETVDKVSELKSAKPNTVEKTCLHHPTIKGKSLKGGKRAGKFRLFKNVKDMNTCIAKCCSMNKNCDVAYMEAGKCFSLSCNKKSLCMAVDKKATDVNPVLSYMDHFLQQAEEAQSSELDQELELSEETKLPGQTSSDFFVVYIIVGSLAFVALAGGIIWAVFVYTKRAKLKNHKNRLLDEEEESVDDLVARPSHTRYRTPMSRY